MTHGDTFMASTTLTNQDQSSSIATTRQPIGGLRFDWLMGFMGFIFVAGLYVDGWAHAHGKVDNTFFTPWHAILYSGYLLNAILLIGTLYINHSRGLPWRKAIPTGYELSLVGVPLFALGGIGDMIWHTLFGFEVGTDQLLSPTHLILATSGILIMTGPLRAAMRRPDTRGAQGWSKLLPMLLSVIALLLMFTFFTEFAHPFVDTWVVTSTFKDESLTQALGVASILLQSAILMGVLLLIIRHWTLPVGSMTLIFTVITGLIVVFADHYSLIPPVIVAGILADILLVWLKPSPVRQNELRLFAFLVPTILYLCYFVDLMLTTGIIWTIHLWLGSCIVAGVVGLVLSYLLVPPQGPTEKTV
jgi:hypothetical protein